MSDKNANNGRAYEFICLHTLYQAIFQFRAVIIDQNSSYCAAQKA